MMQVKDRQANFLNRIAYGGERAVLRRRGKPVAVLVSVEDLHRLQTIEDQSGRQEAAAAEAVHG